jgi:hypothetical protein
VTAPRHLVEVHDRSQDVFIVAKQDGTVCRGLLSHDDRETVKILFEPLRGEARQGGQNAE